MKFIPFLLCFFVLGNLKAQDLPIPNQYLIYFSNGTTTTEVNNIASTWCSTVLENLQPGGNIAVFEFNCNYPFTNPYDPTDFIPDLIGVVTKIKKHEPKAGGGSENYYFEGHTPGPDVGNCYDQSLLLSETGDASNVKVAVFDTGTNWDLANMNGFNFGTPYEMFGDATDKNGHGTHVATLVNKIYLDSNNGNSSINVNYVFGNPLDATGYGTLADMVLSMERAIISGANIINGSFVYVRTELHFGTPGMGPPGTNGHHVGEEDVLYLLMSAADPTKTLFVVAAGNHDGFDLDGPSTLNAYPAAFPLENMITVASHGCLENLSPFSNLGAQSVDIAAPGENIGSIDHEANWKVFSGTSQATGTTSGAASILATHLPYFDAAKIKCAIMTKAAYRPSFNGLTVSEGILDVASAVDFLIEGGCDGGNGNNLGQKKLIQNNATPEVSISPTITTSAIDIAFELKEESPVKIIFYSLNGQTLSTMDRIGGVGSNDISVNLDHLPADGYMLIRIETNEFTKTSKIIRVQ